MSRAERVVTAEAGVQCLPASKPGSGRWPVSALPCVAGFDSCFFCIGKTSAGMDEVQYTHFTHGMTLAVAQMLVLPARRAAAAAAAAASLDTVLGTA